nr:MAG TPA: hypothetical protein [Caudoviricetes sp.]
MFLVGKVGIFGGVGRFAWGDPTAYINRYFSTLEIIPRYYRYNRTRARHNPRLRPPSRGASSRLRRPYNRYCDALHVA